MEETASGETRVTFKVGIDPGSWVPGHIARTLNQQILRESVERLKTEVEAAHTGEPNREATRRRREISRILASMDVRRLRRVRSVPGREETSVTWALSGLEARRYTTEHAWR